jgi:putative (di)nucleoside polyphosphate hydrolase
VAGSFRRGRAPGRAGRAGLYRELQEEIGLTREHVPGGIHRRLAALSLPKRYVRRGRGPTCIGQKQRWFLLRSPCRKRSALRFRRTNEPEFDGWRWANYWEPVREVIYFKRPCTSAC